MSKSLQKISLATGALLASAAPVFAQDSVGSLNIVRLENSGVSSIGRLLSAGFTVAIILAVIFVFFMLIMGGYGWITAGGDKTKVEEARTRITNALIGLAIVAAAWALITIIGQFFGVSVSSLNIPSAAVDNTDTGIGGGGL